MVFTVRTTIYVSEVFYQVLCRLATHTERLQYMQTCLSVMYTYKLPGGLQVVSKGELLAASVLYMTSRQKTFSMALAPSMVPSARVVVHCVLSSGQVLADSLHFRVKGVRRDGVRVSRHSLV